MAKFKTKALVTEGIQWTGKNTEDVIQFLLSKGYAGTKMERHVDTDIWVKVGTGELTIKKDEFVTVDEKGAIATHSETAFEAYWEKVS